MKKKVLITGGSGLLAINWARIIRNKFSVVSILHERLIEIPGVEFDFIPLNSVNHIVKGLLKHKPDIVVNTAGLTNVEACEKYPKLAKEVNTDIAENIAIACNELNIKLVHISTDHLFSGESGMMTEYDRVDPQNMYAITKYEAELKVQKHCQNALIARTNFYGWGPKYKKSFSDTIINSLEDNKKITLFNDVFYTPILIDTLVLAVNDLVNRKEEGVFNIVSGRRISKFEFGVRIAEYFSLDLNLIEKGYLKDNAKLIRRPLDMSLSNNKVCKVLKRDISTIESDLHILEKSKNSRIKI